MKKLASKIVSLALAAAFAVTSVPMVANAAPYYSLSGMVYLTGNDYTTTDLYVSNLGKSDKLKSVKSSAKSVATVESIQHTASTYSTNITYTDSVNKPYNYKYDSYYAYINLKLKKAGTTKISFKIGSKSYSTSLKVMKYTNPAKSITITGVNSNKDISSKTKSKNNGTVKVSKKASNAKIALSAKSGWKITNIEFRNYAQNIQYSQSYNATGVSKATMYVGNLAKGTAGQLSVRYQDKNGAPITLYYSLTK
ncbi:MAG: hypothetical protein NC081_11075 [Roseburia sp.]|nr:hypothetical protein [Roseburia sp.]